MNGQYILFIILCVLFLAILITGILIKRYTKRRLRDIDGFQGIIKHKDCVGKPIILATDKEK